MAEFSLLTPTFSYCTGNGRVTGSVKGFGYPVRNDDEPGARSPRAGGRHGQLEGVLQVGLAVRGLQLVEGLQQGLALPDGAGDHVRAWHHRDQSHPGMRPEPVDE